MLQCMDISLTPYSPTILSLCRLSVGFVINVCYRAGFTCYTLWSVAMVSSFVLKMQLTNFSYWVVPGKMKRIICALPVY